MLKELLWMLVTSALGTLGFAMLLHAPKRAWLTASIIGGVGYMIYWGLLLLGWPDPAALFTGVLAATVLAQFAARKMRMIATIFVTLAIIPSVPGLGLYRAMSYLGQGMNSAGAKEGVSAMISVGMIALAIGVGSFLARRVFSLHKR
ncbi:MAG: threonine/serine exporter family protein [Clostridia bacterium]|nr:threonine/serine exporter family protein [Clostridia bacterium]